MSPREARFDDDDHKPSQSDFLNQDESDVHIVTRRESIITPTSSRTLSTSSSSTSSSNSFPFQKNVSFGEVHIREYNRIVGDHPDTRVGPPISIGWEYTEQPAKILDEYEQSRPFRRRNLRLSSNERRSLLRNVFAVTDEALDAAEQEVRKFQRLREKTGSQNKITKGFVSTFRTMKRRIRRRITKQSNALENFITSGNMVQVGVY